MINHSLHDDVIKWKHFPRYWPFVRGIHRSPVNSPHKGQWRGALMFSLICAWRNNGVNNREAGDLRRHLAHYDVTVVGTCIQAACRVQYPWISRYLVYIEFAQSWRRLFSYLNKIIDNLKKYASNTDDTCNDKNKGSECALNGDNAVNLTARFFFNRRTNI